MVSGHRKSFPFRNGLNPSGAKRLPEKLDGLCIDMLLMADKGEFLNESALCHNYA